MTYEGESVVAHESHIGTVKVGVKAGFLLHYFVLIKMILKHVFRWKWSVREG